MPAIDRLTNLEEHLLQGVSLGDGVPTIEGRADDDCFEAERIEQARKVLERKDTIAVLCVSEIPTIILQSPAREDVLLHQTGVYPRQPEILAYIAGAGSHFHHLALGRSGSAK